MATNLFQSNMHTCNNNIHAYKIDAAIHAPARQTGYCSAINI